MAEAFGAIMFIAMLTTLSFVVWLTFRLRTPITFDLSGIADLLDRTEARMRQDVERIVEAEDRRAHLLRQDLQTQGTALVSQMTESLKSFGTHFAESHRLVAMEQQKQLDQFRTSLEASLDLVRKETQAKLEEIRQMVDERLQQTLEARLGESFRTVSEQLRAVHHGLGEMQMLAADIGNLKKVFSDIRVRGLLGEVLLKNLLDQFLAPSQYAEQVATKSGSNERVEFAVKIPGPDPNTIAWLPIDAKFPIAPYEALISAIEAGDKRAIDEARKKLASAVEDNAKSIRVKYLDPPNTTNVAIMYLPAEGLYAEVVRDSRLVADLFQKHQVLLAGPTTLAALLTTLQMGFRILAIEKKSAEAKKILEALKQAISQFGEAVDKIRKKLDEAQRALDNSQKTTQHLERKLREVETLPETEDAPLPGPMIST